MASFAAQWTVLSVKEHALTDMRLHIALSGFCEFASAIAKGTIRIGDFDQTSARTDRAFLNFGLSHLLYVESTIIYALSTV